MNKKELNALEKLLVIQEVDLKIRDLENQIEQVHARSVQEDPVLNKMRTDLSNVSDSLEAAASQQSMYENTLEDIRSAIKGLAATRTGAFKPRTRSSTEALKIEEDKLATLIEETYGQLERLKVQKEEIEASIGKRAKEMQAAMQEPEAEVRKLRVRVKRLEKQREEALVGIPIPLLRRYERLQASRSGVGLTVMRNGICDVCRMTMPTGVRFRLLKGEMIDLCPACGRMVAKIENTVSIAELNAREQAESAARRSSDSWEETEDDDREERDASFETETDLEAADDDLGEGHEEEGEDERGSSKSDHPTSAKRLAKIKAAGTKRAAEQKSRAEQKSAEPAQKKQALKKAEPKKAELKKPEPKKPEPSKLLPKKPEPKKPLPKKPAPTKKSAPTKPPTQKAAAAVKKPAPKSKPAPISKKKPAKKK
jgi:predicted  nucleic acid-binding Zn-ribbon protein